jgi:hypothetical protein
VHFLLKRMSWSPALPGWCAAATAIAGQPTTLNLGPRRRTRGTAGSFPDSAKAFLTRTLPVDLPYVILTLLAVPVRVASMEDLSNDATASTAPIRKAACSALDTANARLGQLWLAALAVERGAAADSVRSILIVESRV